MVASDVRENFLLHVTATRCRSFADDFAAHRLIAYRQSINQTDLFARRFDEWLNSNRGFVRTIKNVAGHFD